MTYNYKIIARIYGEGSKFTMATFLSLDARNLDNVEHNLCAAGGCSHAVGTDTYTFF